MHTCAEGVGASLIFLVSTLISFSTETQHPELILLEGSIRGRETFCLGERAQLKCIFPKGERALEWYVNGSNRPIGVDFLAEDLPGHNASTPFGNFTIVSIFKEESYRGNYSCGVSIPYPGRDVQSNSVEVLFEDTAPDDITATCISSDSDSITVAVNYTNGCRRETVVQASGVTCKPLSEAPAMTLFECGNLHPNTSYNITADSNGHSHSVTCSTKSDLYRVSGQPIATASTPEHTLIAIGTCSASGALFVIVLVLLIATVTIVRCKRMKPPPDETDKEDDSQSRTEAAVEPHHLQPNPSYCSIEMMKNTQHIAYDNVVMQM